MPLNKETKTKPNQTKPNQTKPKIRNELVFFYLFRFMDFKF